MPSTPTRRRQGAGQRAAHTPDRSRQVHHEQGPDPFQTPTSNHTHSTRLRSATRSAAATASTPGATATATAPPAIHGSPINGSGTWSTNASPNNTFTTPTRPSRHRSSTRTSTGSATGSSDWTNLALGNPGVVIGSSNNNSSGGAGGTGTPGSASSTTPITNSASRQLRGPPSRNPHVTLKRSSGSSGSLSGPGSGLGVTISLGELSPSATGPRTPNNLTRKSQPSPSSQSMRVIPSPFANSPASWLETSFLPSPIKGFSISGGSSSANIGAGARPGAVGSTSSIFEVAPVPNSIGRTITFSGGSIGGSGSLGAPYDGGYLSSVDFFAPAEIHRDRNTVDSMRAWRTDAMHQHMYRTAAYWGDKVLSITVPTYIPKIKTEKWSEALEYLGEENQFAKDTGLESNVNNADGGIKLEASMCYLRGVVFKNLNNIERAKECFKEALQIDVKCYDALDSLVSNSMMTTNEERDLIEGLDFDKQLYGPDAAFVKMLYQSKMKKQYDHLDEQDEIYKALAAKFQTENADLLYSKAEVYFTQCCFEKCLDCTKRILEMDKFNLACIPIHLVSLYELDLKNELFFIAHELVDQHPKHAIAWFAVGVYYYLTRNLTEARRYFGKASTIDPHYGPAWIGFGHSFALEGEHDQAISAYATSMKLFQGSHLGSMYIGMQHLQQNNIDLAQNYLTNSLSICDSDPLLLNEIAVVHYSLGQYDEAVRFLHKVIEKMQRSQRKNVIWETTWLNLAHSYRKLGKYSEAEIYFSKVDAITTAGPTKASALVGLGFIYQIMGQTSDAVECYHRVLAIRPSDHTASEMLRRIMEDRVRVTEMEWMREYLPKELRDDEEVERRLRSMEERNTRQSKE
ncbi:anaphase promoting complex subunit cdc16 [Dissophora globulifera]|uniref:Anaphase promoting complex subunit cdc16 n=1 Tax=Dissophora globulifera TaxID=979702 RepID=A0A9P6RMQ2_9FUNG|nr:anaphase promoting complex subunit cdc16 [Dissophora globulifera]